MGVTLRIDFVFLQLMTGLRQGGGTSFYQVGVLSSECYEAIEVVIVCFPTIPGQSCILMGASLEQVFYDQEGKR